MISIIQHLKNHLMSLGLSLPNPLVIPRLDRGIQRAGLIGQSMVRQAHHDKGHPEPVERWIIRSSRIMTNIGMNFVGLTIPKKSSKLFVFLLALLFLLPLFSIVNNSLVATPANAATINEFPTSPGSQPSGIVTGPDGNLWFAEWLNNKIGQMTPAGVVINEYTVPTAGSNPIAITAGPDGNLWFTEMSGNKIGRITTAGVITEFTVLTPSSTIGGITAGPDGNLWFTESQGNKIGRITTAGSITEFAVPTLNGHPVDITAGPDGNLWFTESDGNSIGRITPAGVVINEYTVPTASCRPQGITAGPDGNLWFTEYYGNKIGRITTAGVITEYTVPTAGSGPDRITAGPGGLWFTEANQSNGNKIGWITTAGVITEFVTPTAGSQPTGITTGPDGNIWFAEFSGNKIGRIPLGVAITEFSIPTASSGPGGITAGPDGNIWFAEFSGSKIGRITTAGVITPADEFAILTPLSAPTDITAGPDGNLWFTEVFGNKIGRITTAGVITEFAIPTPLGTWPLEITAGPDGNLWFTESNNSNGNKIGRITTAGVITEFAVPTPSSSLGGITAGPDGNLWFTESNADKIGRITTAGSITPADEFTIPTAGSEPNDITAGPDGNLWFTEYNADKIGRITTAGSITPADEFAIPTPLSAPTDITAGPDGNLWFTEYNADKIGRITTAGVITEYSTPTAGSQPFFITTGPDGNIWFTEINGNKIGRVSFLPCTYGINLTSQSFSSSGSSGSVNVTAGSGCSWTAISNDPWITITSGNSGSGNGTVNYSIAANAGPARNGTMTIAWQTFTVNQSDNSLYQNVTVPFTSIINPAVPGDPFWVTITLNNNTGGNILTIRPDCVNTNMMMMDALGNIVIPNCRLRGYAAPADLVIIAPGTFTVTCDLYEAFSPSTFSVSPQTYTLTAPYANNFVDPNYTLWTGVIPSDTVQVTIGGTPPATASADVSFNPSQWNTGWASGSGPQIKATISNFQGIADPSTIEPTTIVLNGVPIIPGSATYSSGAWTVSLDASQVMNSIGALGTAVTGSITMYPEVQGKALDGTVFTAHGTVTVLQTPTVKCSLTPSGVTYLCPGSNLKFLASVQNDTDQVQVFQFATKVTLPSGNWYPSSGWLLGPITVTLNPHESRSKLMTQFIPFNAPSGIYTYHGYVGKASPPLLYNQCEFGFKVR